MLNNSLLFDYLILELSSYCDFSFLYYLLSTYYFETNLFR